MRLKFLLLLVISLIVLMSFVSAANVYLDPSGDVQKQWSCNPTTCKNHYSLVADKLRNTDATKPSTSTGFIFSSSGTDIFALTDITQDISALGVEVWIYGNYPGEINPDNPGPHGINTYLNVRGTWTTPQYIQLENTAGWVSRGFSFATPLNKTEINNLQIKIEPLGGSNIVYALYIKVVEPSPPSQETCNGKDDDGDGLCIGGTKDGNICKADKDCTNGKCNKIDEGFDNDGDNYTACGSWDGTKYISPNVNYVDFDDNPLDDPSVCWNYYTGKKTLDYYNTIKSQIDCSKLYYSICSKCKYPDAEEKVNGVDNDGKGHCEDSIGTTPCTLRPGDERDEFGGYSVDCKGSYDSSLGRVVYGPKGAKNEKGYCQMADDYIRINIAEYNSREDIKYHPELYLHPNNPDPNNPDSPDYYMYYYIKGLEQPVLWSSNEYIIRSSTDPKTINVLGTDVIETSSMILFRFRPAASGDAECFKARVWEVHDNYLHTLMEGMSEEKSAIFYKVFSDNKAWRPYTDPSHLYEEWVNYEVLDSGSCLPSTENLMSSDAGYNPDGGNIAGFYNYFVKDNKDNPIYADGNNKIDMREVGWQFGIVKKDKCTDGKDNDGEESFKDALTFSDVNLRILDFPGINLPAQNPNSIKLRLRDVDDPNCHITKTSLDDVGGYCLDADGDKFCGCVSTFGMPPLGASNCVDSATGIKGYNEEGKPIGVLLSDFFPDCDDRIDDDITPLENGGYMFSKARVTSRVVVYDGDQRIEVGAPNVHPFGYVSFFISLDPKKSLSALCWRTGQFLDVNCNKNGVEGYNLKKLIDKETADASPFDYNRRTGAENLDAGCGGDVDAFCQLETSGSVFRAEVPGIIFGIVERVGMVAGIVTIGTLFPVIIPFMAIPLVGAGIISTATTGASCTEMVFKYYFRSTIISSSDAPKDLLELGAQCSGFIENAGWGLMMIAGAIAKLKEIPPGSGLVGKVPYTRRISPLKLNPIDTPLEELPIGALQASFRAKISDIPTFFEQGQDFSFIPGKSYEFYIPVKGGGGIKASFSFIFDPYSSVDVTLIETFWNLDANFMAAAGKIPLQGRPYILVGSQQLPIPKSISDQASGPIYELISTITGSCQSCFNKIWPKQEEVIESKINPSGNVNPAQPSKVLEGTNPKGAEQKYAESQGKNCATDTNEIKGQACVTQSSFLAGTKILMTNGKYKNIEDIKIGEEVVAWDLENNEKETAKVTELFDYMTDKYLIINYTIEE